MDSWFKEWEDVGFFSRPDSQWEKWRSISSASPSSFTRAPAEPEKEPVSSSLHDWLGPKCTSYSFNWTFLFDKWEEKWKWVKMHQRIRQDVLGQPVPSRYPGDWYHQSFCTAAFQTLQARIFFLQGLIAGWPWEPRSRPATLSLPLNPQTICFI